MMLSVHCSIFMRISPWNIKIFKPSPRKGATPRPYQGPKIQVIHIKNTPFIKIYWIRESTSNIKRRGSPFHGLSNPPKRKSNIINNKPPVNPITTAFRHTFTKTCKSKDPVTTTALLLTLTLTPDQTTSKAYPPTHPLIMTWKPPSSKSSPFSKLPQKKPLITLSSW